MLMDAQIRSLLVVILLSLLGTFGILIGGLAPAGAMSTHSPIYINGNAGFTAANGVVGGNGTSNEPYVISGWNISGSSANGIEIRNTTAHFIIENVSVHSSWTPKRSILLINVSNGIIRNSTVNDSYYGIEIQNSVNITITHNDFFDDYYGIFSDSEILIDNNSIYNNTYGVFIYSTGNVRIGNNDFDNNDYGIYSGSTENDIIVNNNFTDNAYGLYLSVNSNYNYVSENDFFNNDDSIYCTFSEHNNLTDNLLDNNLNSILLNRADHNDINNNLLKNNTHGVYIDESYYCNITGNHIEYSLLNNGITISKAGDNLITNNLIKYCKNSIYLSSNTYYQGYNTIRDNRINASLSHGIHISISSYNRILGNSITLSSSNGIYMSYTIYNKLDGNYISRNTEYGIYMEHSNNNDITNSDISETMMGYGAYLYESHFNEFIANRLSWNAAFGISAILADDNDLISNEIEHCPTGFYFDNCENMLLDSNVFENTGKDIVHASTVNTRMNDNKLSGGGLVIVGYEEEHYSSHNIDLSNTVSGRPIRYWTNRIGGTVPEGAGQVIMANCYGVTVRNQYIHNVSIGINLAFSNKCTIEDNIVSGCLDEPIHIYAATNNLILNNTVNNSSNYGVYLDGESYWNVIKGNTIANNSNCGVILQIHTRWNTIDNNIIEWNTYNGIEIARSYDQKITNNTIRYNGLDGLYLDSADEIFIDNNTFYCNEDDGIEFDVAGSNSVSNNTFIGNYLGAEMTSAYNNIFFNNSFSYQSYAMILYNAQRNKMIQNTYSNNEYGISFHYSGYNLLYHNNFKDNDHHVSLSLSPNYWNLSYPECGNYWDDYEGIDENWGEDQNSWGSDGIGDTPLILDIENRDNYPLMKPAPFIKKLPSPPGNFKAGAGNGFVQLTWEPPADDYGITIFEYRIYKDYPIIRSGSRAHEIITVQGTRTGYNDTEVVNGGPYSYQISAVNPYGEGALSEKITAVPGRVPDRPRSLKAFPGEDDITLSWDAPADGGGLPIIGYRIYRGVASGVLNLYKETGPVEEFVDVNISIGINYYYSVSAVNVFGESQRSNEAAALVASVPSAPRDLVLSVGDSYFHLSWNPPANDGGWPVKKYYVYRGESKDYLELIESFCFDTYYNDTDVSAEVTYYYRVTAVNGRGEGPGSAVVSGMIVIPPNRLPRVFISTNVSSGLAPLTVSFNGTGIDYDGEIVKYIWDLGDRNSSNEQNVVHTYRFAGAYYVKLTVIDDDGGSAFTMVTITVLPGYTGPPEDDGKDEERDGAREEESSAYLMGAIGVSVAGLIIILLMLFLNWSAISGKRRDERDERKKGTIRYSREIEITRIRKTARPRTIPIFDAEVATDEEYFLDDDEEFMEE